MHISRTLLLALFLAGCGEEGDAPVAKIGEQPISANQLRSFVERLPDGLKSKQSGDAARRQYLQSLIDRQLILAKAIAHGLDTLQAVERSVREAVDARVIALYRSRFLTPRAAVPEEDVRRVYEEQGYHRERKLNAILVLSRAEIDEVAAKLAAGQPFAEVARAHSLDDRSADKDGTLGFIGREAAPGLHIPAEVFNSLPTGQISQPLPAGRSWHVVLFSADRPTPYERYRPLIEELLFRERIAEVEAENFELLRESTGTALDEGGFRLMLDAAQRHDTEILEQNDATLYTYADKQVSVSAAWQALKRINVQRSLQDSGRALASLAHLVLRPVLLRHDAYARGLYADPVILHLEHRAREGTLLDAVRNRFASVDLLADAEVWAFYDEHPDYFYHEKSTEVKELLIRDLADAIELRDRIAAGASFAEFADRSVRERASESEARFHFHPRDKTIYPQLVPAILGAEEGRLMGPVRVQGGYSLFRVVGKNPGSVETYEQVQRRARALLRRERENRALDDLVKELRQQRADHIQIDEDRLHQALPDSLVSGP
ncbi:MAG: peptidyl-prolyl cis-trans isomerase [Candidatus Latescibacterota bacterium]|nr:peptidyl-prolyl cis-trans isomerase [Candidatus Latescibacterota bacterium]